MVRQHRVSEELGEGSMWAGDPAQQAFKVLYFGYAALPIIAGIDKYFDYLVNWSRYLAPVFTQTFPIQADQFMYAVGAIEILAGIITFVRPSIGGYIVMAWLWAIIINLLLIPGYFDIALRDFGLSLGALALARLSLAFGR